MNDHLSDLQISRIEALSASRSILLGAPSVATALAGNGNTTPSLVGDISPLLQVGHYILTGTPHIGDGDSMSTTPFTIPGFHLAFISVPDGDDATEQEGSADDGENKAPEEDLDGLL